MKDLNVVDLFDEEISKKEKRLNKKMEKARLREEKKQKRLNKKLEKQEDAGFNEYLEKIKEEKLVETAVKVDIDSKEEIDIKKEIFEKINEDLVEAPVKKKKDFNLFEDENKSIEDFLKQDENLVEIEKNDVKNLFETTESIKEKNIEETLFEDIKIEKKHPFLNFLIAVFSIVLLVVSADYIIYNCISNYKDQPTMINSIMLVTNVVFYLLSIIVKNKAAQKTFQILSLICITLFMCYHLFIA